MTVQEKRIIGRLYPIILFLVKLLAEARREVVLSHSEVDSQKLTVKFGFAE